MAWEKSIFIGCTHGDVVCQDAVKAVKRFMDDWKPRHRVHLGDLWDFRALRRGAGPEEKAEKIRYDYNCGLELLDWYKPQILTLGNHDHRPYMAAQQFSNGALADLMFTFCEEMEEDLRKRRIQWTQWGVENWSRLPIGGPKLLHGYSTGLNVARKNFQHYGESIAAHNHTPDSYQARHADGGKAFSVGTLANIKKLSYADGQPAKLGWRNSFLYGLHNTKTGAWQAWEVVKEGNDWISPMGII